MSNLYFWFMIIPFITRSPELGHLLLVLQLISFFFIVVLLCQSLRTPFWHFVALRRKEKGEKTCSALRSSKAQFEELAMGHS